MASGTWHQRAGAIGIALGVLLASGTRGDAAKAAEQAQSPAAQTGFVLGTVVDADSGRPIPGVVVTLSGPPPAVSAGARPLPGSGPPPVPPRVLTNSEGRFLFTGLAPGSINLSAMKSGYLIGALGRTTFDGPGQPLILRAGERRGDVVIKMWRQSSVSGVVTDELGDPAVGVRVHLLTPTFQNGQRVLRRAGLVATDDRGAYRFSSLSPGTYFVAVPQTTAAAPLAVVDRLFQGSPEDRQQAMRTVQQSSGMTPQAGVTIGRQVLQVAGSESWAPAVVGDGERLRVYRTLFHPNETNASQATAIELGSGTDREGIDVQLRLVPAVSLSGTLRGPEGPVAHTALRLRAVADGGMIAIPDVDAATTISDGLGEFTFLGVPAGQYVIVATVTPRNMPPPPPPPPSPPPPPGIGVAAAVPTTSATLASLGVTPPAMTGSLPVAVGQEDLAGLDVVLASGGRVSGRIEFDGGLDRPAGEQLRRAALSFRRLDLDPGGNGQSNVVIQFGPDGRFEANSLLPGRYILSAPRLPPGWNVKAVLINGRDATSTPFELTSADISGVVVTYTDQTTILNGQMAAGEPEGPVWVWVFPADVEAWLAEGMMPDRQRTVPFQRGGAFTIRDLRPGEYVAVASRRAPPAPAADPMAHYADLARVGERVTLRLGLTATVRLSRIQESR